MKGGRVRTERAEPVQQAIGVKITVMYEADALGGQTRMRTGCECERGQHERAQGVNDQQYTVDRGAVARRVKGPKRVNLRRVER